MNEINYNTAVDETDARIRLAMAAGGAAAVKKFAADGHIQDPKLRKKLLSLIDPVANYTHELMTRYNAAS